MLEHTIYPQDSWRERFTRRCSNTRSTHRTRDENVLPDGARTHDLPTGLVTRTFYPTVLEPTIYPQDSWRERFTRRCSNTRSTHRTRHENVLPDGARTHDLPTGLVTRTFYPTVLGHTIYPQDSWRERFTIKLQQMRLCTNWAVVLVNFLTQYLILGVKSSQVQ